LYFGIGIGVFHLPIMAIMPPKNKRQNAR